MCTAISFTPNKHYFGRNLDLEGSFGEGVVVTPRGYRFAFRLAGSSCGYALIGMAIVQGGVPLYYDAVNEYGLGMAGLNFPKNAAYQPAQVDKINLAPFEMIPYVLGRCKSLSEARELLMRVNVTDVHFSPQLKNTPLHWMISDRTGSLVAEPTAEGLKVYENPVHVLTNNPPFPMQLSRLSDYMSLTPYEPENRFSKEVELVNYSRGMGTIGMPGDWSSASRFVRAVFTRFNLVAGDGEEGAVNGFFHILQSVAVPRGCMRLKEGVYEETVYSSCCNADDGVYYYTTYGNPTIHAVSLHAADLSADKPIYYPLKKDLQIERDN